MVIKGVEMNILFLSINVPPGDKRDKITYNFIWKEMKYLALRGHRVYYLSNLNDDKMEDGIFFISKSQRLEKHTFLRRFNNLLFCLKNLLFLFPLVRESVQSTVHICGIERAIIRCIKEFHIDIIHTNFFEPSGEAAVLSARHCRIPIVATLRGAELEKMPELDYGACLDKYYETALKNSIRFVDFFTAPNKFLCNKLHRDFGVPREKIKYIPNGVERISSCGDNLKLDDYMTFISIGRLIKRKNLDLIFNSLPNLFRQNRFKWIIVGDGPLKKNYETIIGKYYSNKVYLHDEMPKEKLLSIICKSNCLIHPSFFEGLPNVVLEALSLGVPCLVSDIPAHQDLIIEGFNGFFFDPHDSMDFVRKMKFILSNRNVLHKMRNNCIESARKYPIEGKIDTYIEIYNNVLKSHC